MANICFLSSVVDSHHELGLVQALDGLVSTVCHGHLEAVQVDSLAPARERRFERRRVSKCIVPLFMMPLEESARRQALLIKHQTYKGEATGAAGLTVLRNERILRRKRNVALSDSVAVHKADACRPDPGT